MKKLIQGFLLIEIMVTLALITMVVGILIRFQVQCLGWQADATALMNAIEESQRVLHDKNHSSCHDARIEYFALTNPVVHGAGSCMSLDIIKKIQVEIFTKAWEGLRGHQECVMPAIVTKR